LKYFLKIPFIILLFFSCSQEKEIYQLNLKYLALGDSYTIGEGILFEHSYPKQIVNEISLIDSVRVIAKTGWTTDELIDTLDNLSLKKYDVVSLLIGVNNQFRGYSIDNYVVEFENLLVRAINYSKDKSNLFVLSIPDYGVTPFGKTKGKEKIYSEINSYNNINRLISEKYNVMYFDITDISREAESDTTLLAIDKLHPSKKMYEMWVEKLKYQLIDSLKNS
jgi:lysophospholipase L1-like esterase